MKLKLKIKIKSKIFNAHSVQYVSDEKVSAGGDISARDEHKQKWFENLESLVLQKA